MSKFIWTEQELCDALDTYYNIYCKTMSVKEDKHIFSGKFIKRMKKLIRQSEYGSITYKVFTQAKRAAIIVLAILITSATLVMSVEALRVKFFDWLFSVTGTSRIDNVKIEYNNIIGNYSETDMEKMRQIYPAHVPNGYVLDSETETVNEKMATINLIYRNEDGESIIFRKRLVRPEDRYFTKMDKGTMESISIGGSEGFYYKITSDYSLGETHYFYVTHFVMWENGPFEFRIHCTIGKEEAIRIAESVK